MGEQEQKRSLLLEAKHSLHANFAKNIILKAGFDCIVSSKSMAAMSLAVAETQRYVASSYDVTSTGTSWLKKKMPVFKSTKRQ